MKKKKILELFIYIIMLIVSIGSILITVNAEKWFNGKALMATIVSGDLSAISTIIIGLITLLQNQRFKDYAEEIEDSVNLSLELFEHEGSKCKDFICRKSEISESVPNKDFIRLFLTNYYKNPVFDVKATNLYYENKKIYSYRTNSMMSLNNNRQRTLKYENSMYLIIEIPNDYLDKNYTIEISFKNYKDNVFIKKYILSKELFYKGDN